MRCHVGAVTLIGSPLFTTVGHFLETWERESAQTRRVLVQLTDESLHCRVAPGYRTAAEIAWHMTTAPREITAKTGLSFEAPTNADAQPETAAAMDEWVHTDGPAAP